MNQKIREWIRQDEGKIETENSQATALPGHHKTGVIREEGLAVKAT